MTATLRTRLTAAVTALALAVGSLGLSATPAAARNNDKTLAWILGLGAAAVILNEIDKNNDRPRVTPAPTVRGDLYRRDDWRRDDWRRDRRDDRRHDDRFEGRRVSVPASCLINVRTREGRREVVAADCARRALGRTELPRACAFDLITGHSRREAVYGLNCLEDNGIRISRR